jgi:hypothetical protein
MTPLRLYIDEDSMRGAFVGALRALSVDVCTVREAGMLGHPDLEQLQWAAGRGRVLYSLNVGDFYALHTLFLQTDRQHAGIILVHQQRYSVGDQVRGVLKLMAARSGEAMVNQLVFLNAWI